MRRIKFEKYDADIHGSRFATNYCEICGRRQLKGAVATTEHGFVPTIFCANCIAGLHRATLTERDAKRSDASRRGWKTRKKNERAREKMYNQADSLMDTDQE